MIDKKALFNLGYGLYVVTTNDGKKDNGLIVNTVTQVTNTPNRIAVVINKENYSCDVVLNTKKMNVCPINVNAKFALFKHFGFQSGRDVNKFNNYPHAALAQNEVYYVTEGTNAYISAYVMDTVDLGTHTMFIANVVNGEILSSDASATYDYYQKNIKKAPSTETKKGWVCKVCGYVYEGENLPEDFICPICKHGAADFEKIQ